MTGHTDPRVEHARQVLAGYDRGRWTAEVNLIGHLAAAVRQLLDVIDEQSAPGGGAWQLEAVRAVLGRFAIGAENAGGALEAIEAIVSEGSTS